MFTVVCPFSGWYWAIPTADDNGLTAAQIFAERVMFDLSGVPVLLCSDRAKNFVEGVITYLNDTFGIQKVLGSALHPQSQGADERPHREYKTMCKQFMQEFGNQWDMVAPLFQWTVRTSCKVYNGNFTPYEIITGMKPRTAIDALLSTPNVVQKRTTDSYVLDLVKYLKKVHSYVQTEHKRVRDQQQEYKLRHQGPDSHLAIGDYVMLQGIPKQAGEEQSDDKVSGRFKHKTDKRLFQIFHAAGGDESKARAFTLMDPATGSTKFEFSQPVAADRLVPVEVLPLTKSHDEVTRLKSRNRTGTVEATSVDGRVHVKWDGKDVVEVCDLTRMPHEFIL